MWVMTTRGFFSAVQKRTDPPGMLTVRARTKGDLENLRDLLPDLEVVEQQGTDYLYRIKVSSADWARVMASLTLDIDYHNFKNEVKRHSPKHEAVYHKVWTVLLALEPKGKKTKWSYGGYTGLYQDERLRALTMTRQGKTIKQIAKALGNGVTESMVRNDGALKSARKQFRGGGQPQLPAER